LHNYSEASLFHLGAGEGCRVPSETAVSDERDRSGPRPSETAVDRDRARPQWTETERDRVGPRPSETAVDRDMTMMMIIIIINN